jgi:methylglutaconyl-CoA hydratase
MQIGLVHLVRPLAEIDTEVDRLLKEVKSSAPGAVARAKALVATVPHLATGEAMQLTAETIAALRVGTEGQEGLQAFLEKRRAEWA